MELSDRKRSSLLILLCWAVYTCAYLGKYSYTANTLSVIADYGITKAEAGLASTLFFAAYGTFQIIHGFFCRHYPKKIVIFSALAVSAAVNAVIYAGVPFDVLKVLWFINGVAQSTLWPTLLLTISQYVARDQYKSAVLAMSSTVAVGTILAYCSGALYVEFAGNYHLSFLTATIALGVIACVWLFFYPRLTAAGPVVPEAPGAKPAARPGQAAPASGAAIAVMVVFLGFCGVVDNLVKDGLNTWVPNILNETYGLEVGASMVLTLSLSVIGIFGAAFAVTLQKKIPDFTLLTGALFAFASLFLGGVLLLFRTPYWLPVVVVFGFLSLLMHSINNVSTSMMPLYLGDRVNAGMLSGIMNGACYVGSALSSYCLGAFADANGWNGVFYLLLGCTVLPAVLSLPVWLLCRKKSAA